MDIKTGEIFDSEQMRTMFGGKDGDLTEAIANINQTFPNIRMVPDGELSDEVTEMLKDGQSPTIIDLSVDNELARWARKERLRSRAIEIVKSVKNIKNIGILEEYVYGQLDCAMRDELSIINKTNK